MANNSNESKDAKVDIVVGVAFANDANNNVSVNVSNFMKDLTKLTNKYTDDNKNIEFNIEHGAAVTFNK